MSLVSPFSLQLFWGEQRPINRLNLNSLLQFLKMERRNKWSRLRAIFHTFFMQRNSLKTNQQLLFQILQCLTYIIIINGVHNHQISKTFKSGPNLLLLMILLVLVRYFLRISLGIGAYLIALQLVNKFNNSYTYVIFVIIAFMVIAQTISSISFDVSLQNVKSESRNVNKIIHNIFLTVNVILVGNFPTSVYLHISSFVFLTALFVLKSNSLIKNDGYRSIMLRFYAWASLEHLRLFLNNFISTNSLLVFFAFAFGSQILYSIYISFSSDSNLYEHQAKEEYLKLGFYVLRNSFTDVYIQPVESFVKSLADQEELDQLQPGQITTHIILRQLNKTKGFLESLLKIQINIINGHLLPAKEMLTALKEKTKWFNLIDRILLYRMQQQIFSRYEDYSNNATVLFQQEYQQYLNFQQLLHKASIQHLKYNLYLKKSEVQLECIKEMCTKIIEYDEQIHLKYSEIKDHFTTSTFLFIAYLHKISNDYSTIGKVVNQQKIKEKHVSDFNLEEKIYIRLKLQQSGLGIDKVGYNCKELLDYNRKDLEGQQIERIVPPFFRKQHQALCSAFIHQHFQKMFLFQKNIVVLNNKNSYSQCSVMTKLNYRLCDDFYFEGHLHITENKQHDLSSFLFIDDKGSILEFGEGVIEEDLQETNNLNISQLFDGNTIGSPLARTGKNGLQVFQCLLFNSNRDLYFYFKKKKQFFNLPQLQINTQEKQQKLNQQILDADKPKSFDGFEQKIQSKQVVVMLVLCFIFIVLLFGSEYLMIYSAQVKYNNQKFAVGNCRVLMSYYNNSLKLQFTNIYLQLRDNYNYSNTFFLPQTISGALKMQSINDFLKPYVLSNYKLPTFSSKISYTQNNFELIQNLIVNSYIYQQFKNDAFMRKLILDNNKLLIPVIALSTTDYRITLFNIMSNFVKMDLYYEQLALGVGLANILVFVIFAVRLFCRLRSIQEDVLELRCNGGYNNVKTQQILEFLHEISHQEVQTDKISQEIHMYDTLTKTQTDSMFLKSEMSLIKEPTGRSLMNDSLNKTGFVEQLNRDQNNLKIEAPPSYYFRKGKSHRYILVVFGSLLLILLSLHVSNEILNYRLNDLDEVMSINSVISLFRTSGFFGSRACISTLNSILLKLSTGVDSSKSYNATIQAFYLYMQTVALPVFPQTSIQQFGAFTIKINNLYQNTICSYMACNPLYYDQVNLNFVSVINKISANLTRLANQTMSLTPAQFTAFLAVPSNRLYIDLIFYSQSIMRAYITDMIMLYLDNYFQFIEDLYQSKLIYIGSMIGLTILGLILFLALVKHIRDEKRLFFKILKIYK